MIIDRNYSRFVVFREDTIASALEKINANKSRLVFVVAENGHLEGVITDGDVRRWLTGAQQIDLSTPAATVMNTDFVSLPATATHDMIRRSLNARILAIPLLDGPGRLVAVALQGATQLAFGDRMVGEDSPCFIIAEIGNNHNGSLDAALRLIDLAAEAGVDCAKFQMRDLKSMYRAEGADADSEDLGAQYTLDLLARFQLSDDDLYRAFDHCAARGLTPLCTPFDLESLRKLDAYGLPGFKIASADFTNYDLLRAVAATGKPMICSTGMSTEAEVISGVAELSAADAAFVLLHCNSTYPTPNKDINLRYMARLRELGQGLVGYSGHERGIHVPVAAVALGARVVEKHFTTDRRLEGNDHRVSLLPAEMGEMIAAIRQVEEAMGVGGHRSLSQGEMMNREVLAKSLIARVAIPAGTPVTADMLDVRSPGQGLQPNRKADLIGTVLAADKAAGDYFYPSDLADGGAVARDYSFANPFGIPVRYHDLDRLKDKSNFDLLEIHLSYKDMDLAFTDYISAPLDMDLVVHAPELFAGDHTLDLSSPDTAYRDRSVAEMQRVIDLTRALTPWFTRATRPVIVTNMGGFSSAGFMSQAERAARYATIEDSLSRLDMTGVEIIPQTMPPYPWHFGGQQYHNLFMHGEEIRAFCTRNGMRVCLDISHSKLTCTEFRMSVSRFMELVGTFAAHYHLADATGIDGEGLQIGTGEIDWVEFMGLMQHHSPEASFIPEIWQGHKNDGEGGWLALDRLETAARQAAAAGPDRA